MINWDRTFMSLAQVMSERSKDPSSQIGAVIIDPRSKAVISTGYNGMPRKVNDHVLERYARPEKYFWFEHAERNAIFNAARLGHKTEGSCIYIYGLPPCSRCSRAIIQSGIVEIVSLLEEIPERWASDMETARSMLKEAKVNFRSIS